MTTQDIHFWIQMGVQLLGGFIKFTIALGISAAGTTQRHRHHRSGLFDPEVDTYPDTS
jgi:hypothetical protein